MTTYTGNQTINLDHLMFSNRGRVEQQDDLVAVRADNNLISLFLNIIIFRFNHLISCGIFFYIKIFEISKNNLI